MKKYFCIINNQKEGPLTLEEIIKKDIRPNTLVWHEGLEEWSEARTITELREELELRPPNIPNENRTFKNEPEATQKNITIRKYFSSKGRIGRLEYVLSLFALAILFAFLNELVLNQDYTIFALLYIPGYWFIIAQGAKRCHDLDISGWWQIVPFYIVALIFLKGNNFINKYGGPS